MTTGLLPKHEVCPSRGILTLLVECQDPQGPVLDLMWEDGFGSVDKEEWGLAGGLSHGGADGPQHGLELIDPTPATSFKLLLEAHCLEAPQDLRVGALRLAVAPQVGYRGVAYLCSKVSAIGPEEVTCELRTVVGDDAVGDAESAYEALDELDG